MSGKQAKDEKNDFRTRIFFAVVTLVVGVGLLIVRHLTVTGIGTAQNWTPTPCTIAKSEFVQDDEGGRWLELSFRYKVQGIRYTGSRLDMLPGRMGNDDDWESAIFAKHPVGSLAMCYVDPSNPERSVFDNQHGAADGPNLLLLSLPFLAMGCVLLISGIWSLSHAQAVIGTATISLDQFAPPPRRLNFAQILGIMIAPKAVLVAMGFFMGFLLLFRLLDGPEVVANMFPGTSVETQGVVTGIQATSHNQLNGKVLQYKFEYEFANQSHTGVSYSTSKQHEVGDTVQILVDPVNPKLTRIAGFRRQAISIVVLMIPAFVLILLAFGIVASYLTSFRLLRLFRNGAVAKAKLSFAEETDVINPNTRHSFRVGDQEFRVDDRSMLTPDMKTAFVLYDPSNPRRNTGLSAEKTALLTVGLSIWKVVLFSIIPPTASLVATIWLWNL